MTPGKSPFRHRLPTSRNVCVRTASRARIVGRGSWVVDRQSAERFFLPKWVSIGEEESGRLLEPRKLPPKRGPKRGGQLFDSLGGQSWRGPPPLDLAAEVPFC